MGQDVNKIVFLSFLGKILRVHSRRHQRALDEMTRSQSSPHLQMITDFSHLYKSLVVVFRLIVESAGQKRIFGSLPNRRAAKKVTDYAKIFSDSPF